MRIVIVDDNLDGAESLASVLEDFGHQVTIADNGARALAACAEAKPAVAFIDLLLPDMDGTQVARQLRQRFPQTLLIAVTGLVGQDVKDGALAAGFAHFLLKPYQISALEQILADVPPGPR
jgi:CheY-like chemotaxis protein